MILTIPEFSSFRIDSTLGRDSVFGIVVDDTVNHYINSVEFRDSGGQVYGPFTSFTNDFNVINLKTINFPQDSAAPPFDDVSLLNSPSFLASFHSR